MIKIGDKVEYIGKDSPNYILRNGDGKTGTIVSAPYQLSSANPMQFVDVDWFLDVPLNDPLLTEKPGHVVNVNNLKVLYSNG